MVSVLHHRSIQHSVHEPHYDSENSVDQLRDALRSASCPSVFEEHTPTKKRPTGYHIVVQAYTGAPEHPAHTSTFTPVSEAHIPFGAKTRPAGHHIVVHASTASPEPQTGLRTLTPLSGSPAHTGLSLSFTPVKRQLMADQHSRRSRFLGKLDPKLVMKHQTLMSGVAYCITSFGMTILNKMVVSSHKFDYPTTLTAFQCCVALGLVMLSRRVGLAKCTPIKLLLVMDWIPISFLFVGMIWTSTLVMKHLGVPTMSVLKNINNFLIIVGEYVLYRRMYRSTVWATLVLILLSSYCSAVTDLKFDMWGLFWQLLNSFSTAAYTLLLRKQMNTLKKKLDDNIDTCTNLLFQTLIAVPLLTTVSVLTGEMSTASADPALTQPGFWWTAWMGACGSFLISVCATWFMTNTTATTFGIVSALSKIPTVLFSILFMGQATSMKNLLSVGFGILAGALFVWEKQRP